MAALVPLLRKMQETDRRGQAHKVFFDHVAAQRIPRNKYRYMEGITRQVLVNARIGDWVYTEQWLTCSELSSGMYCRVKWLSTDVSEVRTASIIKGDHSILNIILAAVRTWNLTMINLFENNYRDRIGNVTIWTPMERPFIVWELSE
jgi:hypothetical protein